MKVLILVPYQGLQASTRFRIEPYLEYLKANGIDCKLCPAIPLNLYNRFYRSKNSFGKICFQAIELINRCVDIVKSSSYDILLIQKGLISINLWGLERLTKIWNRNIIFDFDDAVFLRSTQEFKGKLSFFQDRNQISKIIQMSKWVIVGNGYLKDYALRFNQNTTIIPTCIDTERYVPREKNSKDIVIGWTGSAGTNRSVNLIANVITSLSTKYNFTFEVISNSLEEIDTSFFKGVKFVFKRWSPQDELENLQNFDIGLMPLTNNEWNLGKCGFKALQYMALEIPAVCSSVGVNKEIITDGLSGFLATSEEEWIDKLSCLIKNASLRKKLGKEGRKAVLERYSVKIYAPKLKEILEKVAAKNRGDL